MDKTFSFSDKEDINQEPFNYNLEKRIDMLTEKIIETTELIRKNNNLKKE